MVVELRTGNNPPPAHSYFEKASPMSYETKTDLRMSAKVFREEAEYQAKRAEVAEAQRGELLEELDTVKKQSKESKDLRKSLRAAENTIAQLERTVAAQTHTVSQAESRIDEKQRWGESMEIFAGQMRNANEQLKGRIANGQRDRDDILSRANQLQEPLLAAADFLDDLLTLEPEIMSRYLQKVSARYDGVTDPDLPPHLRQVARLNRWRGRDAHVAAERIRAAKEEHDAYDLIIELRGEGDGER